MDSKETATSGRPIFRERVLPSAATFFVPLLVAPSIYLVFLPINTVFGLVFGIVTTMLIWLVMIIGSPVIELSNGEIRVSKAHVPLRLVALPRVVTADNSFDERGPALNVMAFARFQIGIRELVRFEIKDDSDPTPYWLISTRRAEELVQLIGGEL